MLEIKPGSQFALEEEITIQAITELDHYYAFNTYLPEINSSSTTRLIGCWNQLKGG